jgi:insulysin
MKEDENNLIDVNTRLLDKSEMETHEKVNNNLSYMKSPTKRNYKKISLENSEYFDENSKFELLLYIIIVTFLFVVLIFIFYYLHYAEYKVDVILEDKDIFKPMIDMRKYKLINLQNNLEVLLISDSNTTKCSASMSVGVGSFYDGDLPGLAHFTEHMIFLGSKSYPRPSLFEDHLRNYLGSTNAYTEEERTTFYFEVEWQGFTKAIEMFSRMFAEPLFDKNFMNKEIDAVNSENEKNLNKDPWRENQVLKSLADPLHPYSKFSTGNRKTLQGVNIDTLHSKVNFLYDQFYMPDNMKLVVLSNQNLEQLQQTVAYYFSDIRKDKMEQNLRKGEDKSEKESNSINISELNSEAIEPIFEKPNPIPIQNTAVNPYLYSYHSKIPFTSKESGQIIWYEKIAGGQHLDIIFNLDEILTKYQTKPLDYVSYLMKYSGEGSLIEYLKKFKLASKIEVGVVSSFKLFSQYAVSVYLTEVGMRKIEEVVKLVFNYINLIKFNVIKSRTYEELHNITSIQFKFLEKSEKYGDYLAVLAGMMHNIKSTEYYNLLYADYIHSNYNETLIRSYLNNLSPVNSLIIVGSLKFPNSLTELLGNATNQTEKWYGTTFRNNKIPPQLLKTLNNSLISGETFKLREKNDFITRENNVVSCFGIGIITSYKNVTLHELCDMEKADLTPDFAINSKNLLAWYKVSNIQKDFKLNLIKIVAG